MEVFYHNPSDFPTYFYTHTRLHIPHTKMGVSERKRGECVSPGMDMSLLKSAFICVIRVNPRFRQKKIRANPRNPRQSAIQTTKHPSSKKSALIRVIRVNPRFRKKVIQNSDQKKLQLFCNFFLTYNVL